MALMVVRTTVKLLLAAVHERIQPILCVVVNDGALE